MTRVLDKYSANPILCDYVIHAIWDKCQVVKVIFSKCAFHSYIKACNTWKCIWSLWQVWTPYMGVLPFGLCVLESLEWVFQAWKCLYIWRDNYFWRVLYAYVKQDWKCMVSMLLEESNSKELFDLNTTNFVWVLSGVLGVCFVLAVFQRLVNDKFYAKNCCILLVVSSHIYHHPSIFLILSSSNHWTSVFQAEIFESSCRARATQM